jgi:hypothetical protein
MGPLARPFTLCYTWCVQETITIRPTVSKTRLNRIARGNLNKWINGLIEQAVAQQAPDWDDFFQRPRRKVVDHADAVRRAGR